MLTYDPKFVAFFLPALLAAYWLLRNRGGGARIAVLLAASALFYWLADPRHAPLVASLVLVNFAAGAAVTGAKGRGRIWIAAGTILLNIAVLAAYKYAASPADLAGAEPAAGLIQTGLPLGLSFFILKQISWIADLTPAEAEPVGIREMPRFALYSIFFPQMVAGPIFRYRDAAREYEALETGAIAPASLALGLSVFAVGLAKKLLIADPIGGVVDPIYAAAAAGHALSVAEAWAAGWCYLIQLYFDFSGISDIALGIGLMVGLRLPINFYSPLKARSATEYFDRWHISLVVFIRTYVYAPLFRWVRRHVRGNATSRAVKASAAATLLSLSLFGWWHGARPTYILCGFVGGLIAVAYQLAELRWPSRGGRGPARRLLARVTVLLGLVLICVLFRSGTLATAGAVYRGLAGLGGGVPGENLLPQLGAISGLDGILHAPAAVSGAGLLIAAIATVLAFAAPNTIQIFDLYDHPGAPQRPAGRATRIGWRMDALRAAVAGLLIAAALMQGLNGDLSTTIYARF
ncbi:MAG: alginate O-acetyltransferase complex protein AlgI [Sphingomonadales bacterium]|nr:alginate O-acetyltransferase complex protein AlgI [Sphingomonadales bacterium]